MPGEAAGRSEQREVGQGEGPGGEVSGEGAVEKGGSLEVKCQVRGQGGEEWAQGSAEEGECEKERVWWQQKFGAVWVLDRTAVMLSRVLTLRFDLTLFHTCRSGT